MSIQRVHFSLHYQITACWVFFLCGKNCFNFAGTEGSKCHPPWGLWFQGTSLPIACVCGEQRFCVCTTISLPKPSQRLSGRLPCWGPESNWNLSPHTAQKLGNFSARCRAIRKSTTIAQGQGAQLERRCRQGLAVGPVGSEMAREAAMCPRSRG